MGNLSKNLDRKSRSDVIDAAFRSLSSAALRGSGVRALLGRRIAYSAWPEVFKTLNFAEDHHFLEPLLFVAGVMPEITADLPVLLNPRAGQLNLNCAPFFIPDQGYWDAHGQVIRRAGSVHGIALLDRGIQGLGTLIGPYSRVDDRALSDVKNAVDLLAAIWPTMFAALRQSCRRIVPFLGSTANSFASESMPYTVFLNLSQGSSLAAVLEDLTHQSIHCLFSDIEQLADLYCKPPGDQLDQHGGAVSGHRTISVLHHSCLTLAASAYALERALLVANLSNADRLEIQARIGFICRKMALDLTTARHLDALRPDWHRLFWGLLAGLRPQDSYAAFRYDA